MTATCIQEVTFNIVTIEQKKNLKIIYCIIVYNYAICTENHIEHIECHYRNVDKPETILK